MSITFMSNVSGADNRRSGPVPFAVIKMSGKLRSLIRKGTLKLFLSKNLLLLGSKYDYGLFEINDKVSWPIWLNNIISDGKTKKLFIRVSFGSKTMFSLSEKLVNLGWRIHDFSPYGDDEEIRYELEQYLEDSLEGYSEFFKKIYEDKELFFGIRAISLEKIDEGRGVDIDSLTSTIVVFDNRENISEVKYRDLLQALNETLKESR